MTYSLDARENIEQRSLLEVCILLQVGVLIKAVAGDVVGDITYELGEEGDFKYLVEGDELKVGDGCGRRDVGWWRRAIRETASSCRINLLDRIWAGSWEAILQRECKRCGSRKGGESCAERETHFWFLESCEYV